VFSATEDIYNNEDGASLGYEINRNRVRQGTVALDSWLTIGQILRTGTDVQFGVPKNQDQNGAAASIGIGNNLDSLLKNKIPAIGIPLNVADGFMPNPTRPTDWLSQGFTDFITGEEATIFSSDLIGKSFESNNVFIRNSGSIGVNPDSNYILLAQITSVGELSFEINIEVVDKNGKLLKYVADGGTLLKDEIFSPFLKYPPICGCQDPNYLEFDKKFSCNNQSKCKTPIVYGCMDPMSCNFNPKANYHIETLCCYIGYCNDLDIEVVCPQLKPRSSEDESVVLYPNPVSDVLNIAHKIDVDKNTFVEVTNSMGVVIYRELLRPTSHTLDNIKYLPCGNYYLSIKNEKTNIRRHFIKLN
jgi:hypothetical protein